MMFAKRLLASATLAAGLVLSMFSPANAALIFNFIDGYDVANWTIAFNGSIGSTGSVDLSGAPNSVVIIGPNDSPGSSGTTSVNFTTTALADGVVSFDWSSTLEPIGAISGPFYDPFGFVLNSTFTQLSNNKGASYQNGSAAFSVLAGDVFGFRQASLDNLGGPGVTTISNFSGPSSAAPEPASLALLGLGLAGLGFTRRRKRA